MDRTPVDSSNIASIGYDANSETLEIEFSSGTIYQYFKVPGRTHSGLMAARSKGSYFNKYLKDQFSFNHIK